MRLIAVISALVLATAASAAGPEDGPDGAVLLQAAKSIVQVISTVRARKATAPDRALRSATTVSLSPICMSWRAARPTR